MVQKRFSKLAQADGSADNLGFEEKLWAAADKLRGRVAAAEYKHVVLVLVLLSWKHEPMCGLDPRASVERMCSRRQRSFVSD
jgi:hypothetical protein